MLLCCYCGVFLTLLLRLCAADHPENGVDKFVTRPDIVAPRWDVKVYDQDAIAPGHWFMTPYERIGERKPGGAWVGPHIYDGSGQLIWSGSYLFNDINIMDFKLSNVRGEDRLTMMYPVEGLGYIFDNHYQIVEKVPVGETGVTLNMHEFNFVEDGKTLLLLKRNTTYASKEASALTGYDGECHVTWDGFEEVDTENWETKFAWNTWDHVGLDESTMDQAAAKDRCGGGAWDFIHTNALDKFTDGNYLLSGRHTDTIYKISKDDGSIIWRLGGRKSDFELGAANFSRQHHARFIEQNETHTLISVFDNAKGADRQVPSSPNSRGLIIALRTDKKPMTVELVQHYDHPKGPGGYAYRRGDFQILPNKNAFLCWSEQSLQSEHTPDGKIIMEARMVPDWIGTYRGFKYEFVGLPKYPPDVVSAAFSHGHLENSTQTTVHVSWNGATEVSRWNLYRSTEDGATEVRIASEKRKGFETAIEYDGYASYVVVEGMGRDGRPLGRSEVITTKGPPNMSTPEVEADLQWLKDAAESKKHPAVHKAKLVFFDNPLYSALGFLGGFVCTPIVFVLIRWLRQRRAARAWHRDGGSYAHLRERDAAEYDETKLDDLSSDGHLKDEDSEQFQLTGDDDDDEHGDSDVGRVNGQSSYLRPSSGR